MFPRRDLDGNELKKLLPGLFSNLVSLQTFWVNYAFLQVLFYKHNMATFHNNDSLRFAQETYVLNSISHFSFFLRIEVRRMKKEARKLLKNVSFGSSLNSLRPSANVELFIRRAKFSELSSTQLRRRKSTGSDSRCFA